ncbi:hypothetical protein Bca101_099965 [Brassica carinata]
MDSIRPSIPFFRIKPTSKPNLPYSISLLHPTLRLKVLQLIPHRRRRRVPIPIQRRPRCFSIFVLQLQMLLHCFKLKLFRMILRCSMKLGKLIKVWKILMTRGGGGDAGGCSEEAVVLWDGGEC